MSIINVLNRSSTSQSCHQHIKSPTSVINIDIAWQSFADWSAGIASNMQWLQTEIKPRFCKTSEHYFLSSHLKVLVKLPLKIEEWGSGYLGSRDYLFERKIRLRFRTSITQVIESVSSWPRVMDRQGFERTLGLRNNWDYENPYQ